MAMTINTNVVSINAQRNLGLSGGALGISMQRLSSGLRVNSAKDDAAGLAIAERMGAQMRGLKVASRNANDGVSLAQTAEGALSKVGDMLQRMRELSVQSSNATNSANDRKALQAEVAQLRSEIDRVAKSTAFNGKKILDGGFAGGVFQVGAGAGDNISVAGITNAKVDALGKAGYGSNASATVKASDISNLDEIDAGTLSIQVGNGAAIDLGVIKEASSGQERLGQVVAAINAKTSDTGVTAFLVEDEAAAGSYKVELRSDDSEKGISLTGFTAATTGVGRTVSAGMSSAAVTAYNTLVGKIDALLSPSKTALANTGTGASEITIANLRDVFTDAAALVTDGHLTDDQATAIAVTATSSGAVYDFQALVVSQGLRTAATDGASPTNGVAATAFTHATTALTIWKTASNVTGQTTDTATDTPADISVIKDALTGLKAELAEAWSDQQTANLATVDAAFTTLKGSTKANFAANLTALEGALSATGVGLLPTGGTLGVPAISATSTDADFQAAMAQAVTDTNYLTESGFGIRTNQVQDDHIGLADIDIGTQEGAWVAIKHIDAAIDQVNAARGDLGALQTRFEKTIENIDIMNENISAAKGRIVDADFATETANLSRSQILQQAGTAMVAQANQLPQQVLSLLR